MRRVSQELLEEALRSYSASVHVDCDALARNFKTICHEVSPAWPIAVIKANALGFGAPVVGKVLEKAGAKLLAVSHFTEGLELRRHGIKTGILVMNGLLPEQMRMAANQDISFFVFDSGSLKAANDIGKSLGRPVRVHIKIDTGMGRLGALPDSVQGLKAELDRAEWVHVEGVASHLASPYREDHDDFSRKQYSEFVNAASIIDPEHRSIWHFAASSGTLRFPETHSDAVRVGALLHGIGRVWPMPWPLERPGSFTAKVVQVKRLPIGHNVGYTLHYTTQRDTRMAVIPVGTLDGLTGDHADTGYVLVRGQRCRIIGICSCEMMVDVTDVEGVTPGDEVVIFGSREGSGEITAIECASQGKTSYANITGRISRRVPRLYWSQNKVRAADVNGDIVTSDDWGF